MSFKQWRKKERLSEREMAVRAQLSRRTVRAIEEQSTTVSIQSLLQMVDATDENLIILSVPTSPVDLESSTMAISYKILRDGFSSWKTHFMELVDEFRETLDPRLVLLPPPKDLPIELRAMLASIVLHLSQEVKIDSPRWAQTEIFLESPWFPSETESLKALALVESGWAFRRNNIFVHSNFLTRV